MRLRTLVPAALGALALAGSLVTAVPASADDFSRPDRGFAPPNTVLRDAAPGEVGLDPAPIAEAVGLSRSQLTRLSVRHRGVGPAEMLRRARVDRARHLLRTSTLAIKEVARVCGFVSQNHFSRVYFETTGTRPSAEQRG